MRDVIPAPVPGLDLRREYGHHQSPAIRAGGLIFCSGMTAINPETGEREHGTVTSETRRIFENLKLLLAAAGSSLDRIVQVHAMIYDRIEYDVLNRAYRQYVPNAPPARTVMSVQIEAGFKVMLDVIAAAERRDGAEIDPIRQVVNRQPSAQRIAEIRASALAGCPNGRLRICFRHDGNRSGNRRPVTRHGCRRDAADPDQHGASAGCGRLLARQSGQGQRADLFDARVRKHEAVYREFFPTDPPARTVCGARLIGGHKVEIECVALA